MQRLCSKWQTVSQSYEERWQINSLLWISLCFVIVSALTLLVGWQEGHPACKKTEWWGADVDICLEQGAYLHMAQLMPLPLTVSCFSKIQIGFTFLVPAHPGSPGKGPLNGCVCLWLSWHLCLQCFDTGGWIARSASELWKNSFPSGSFPIQMEGRTCSPCLNRCSSSSIAKGVGGVACRKQISARPCTKCSGEKSLMIRQLLTAELESYWGVVAHKLFDCGWVLCTRGS